MKYYLIKTGLMVVFFNELSAWNYDPHERPDKTEISEEIYHFIAKILDYKKDTLSMYI